MDRLLNDDIVKQIREVFNDLKNPVQLMFFGSKTDCMYCDDTRQLVEEVAATSWPPNITWIRPRVWSLPLRKGTRSLTLVYACRASLPGTSSPR
jgi:hypothetical protein